MKTEVFINEATSNGQKYMMYSHVMLTRDLLNSACSKQLDFCTFLGSRIWPKPNLNILNRDFWPFCNLLEAQEKANKTWPKRWLNIDIDQYTCKIVPEPNLSMGLRSTSNPRCPQQPGLAKLVSEPYPDVRIPEMASTWCQIDQQKKLWVSEFVPSFLQFVGQLQPQPPWFPCWCFAPRAHRSCWHDFVQEAARVGQKNLNDFWRIHFKTRGRDIWPKMLNLFLWVDVWQFQTSANKLENIPVSLAKNWSWSAITKCIKMPFWHCSKSLVGRFWLGFLADPTGGSPSSSSTLQLRFLGPEFCCWFPLPLYSPLITSASGGVFYAGFDHAESPALAEQGRSDGERLLLLGQQIHLSLTINFQVQAVQIHCFPSFSAPAVPSSSAFQLHGGAPEQRTNALRRLLQPKIHRYLVPICATLCRSILTGRRVKW